MSFANFLEESLLNQIFRAGTPISLANVFISLHTGAVGEAGANEVTAGDYARISVAAVVGQWTDPSAGTQGETDNVNDILFAVATSAWGTITDVGLFDALTVGNFLMGGVLTASKVIGNGDQLKFAVGDLNIQLD